jgi:DNA (cytosine-5)-methyltransferase 1
LLKQNKGELSEVYALLKLINQRLVSYGDDQGNPTQQQIRVIRIHNGSTTLSLTNISVEIIDTNTTKTVKLSDLFSEQELHQLVSEIKQGKSTFSNQKIDDAIAQLHLSKTKGTSKDKADITLSFEEKKQTFDVQGIGIKSFLGAAPTLLNASQATNFIYEITTNHPLISEQIDAINNIETNAKIRDRIQAIQQQGGQFRFHSCENSIYESNLRKVDSNMPVIIADALLNFFSIDGQKALSSYPNTIHDKQKANEITNSLFFKLNLQLRLAS